MGGAIRPTLSIRAATKADLDAIVPIVLVAFPDEAGCDYNYPFREEHPDDYWKLTRLMYEEYLEQPDKFVVLVATAPSKTPRVGQVKYRLPSLYGLSAVSKKAICGGISTIHAFKVYCGD